MRDLYDPPTPNRRPPLNHKNSPRLALTGRPGAALRWAYGRTCGAPCTDASRRSHAQTVPMPTPTIPQLLDFAAAHPVVRGEVENQIRRDLGITPARYFQLLGRAAASLEARSPLTGRSGDYPV